MGNKRIYSEQDCEAVGTEFSIRNNVVVVRRDVQVEGMSGQLAFCLGGKGAEPNTSVEHALLVDLITGEHYSLPRADVIGVLYPELLPEEEKMQLSQIRPMGAIPLNGENGMYSGYSFLEDGRYAAGVWLCSESEAMEYVKTQMRYQYRVMLCDRDDFCVLEIVDRHLVYPNKETLGQVRVVETSALSGPVQC